MLFRMDVGLSEEEAAHTQNLAWDHISGERAL